MKRKFITGKFKLTIIKICYMSSCSTKLSVVCQETNKKELWGTAEHLFPHSNNAVGDYF